MILDSNAPQSPTTPAPAYPVVIRRGRPQITADFAVSPMQAHEVGEVARVHYHFFGGDQGHGASIANLGPEFLERVFYGLNIDNPHFFVDVARYRGRIVGFSVYASDGQRVFRETLRRHFGAATAGALRVALRHPGKFIHRLLRNLQFFNESTPAGVHNIPGWYFLLGVLPEYRTREFKRRTGLLLADELWHRMERTLAANGCRRFWSVVGAHNRPMNELHYRMGMDVVARGIVQGLSSIYYTKALAAPEASGAPKSTVS